jgi:peptide/nickel transport system permease protein
LRKFLRALLTALAAVTFTFFLIRLLPGNPIEVYINQLVTTYAMPYNEAQDQAASLFSLDLDQPVIFQYLNYLGNLLRGDLGTSILSPGTSVVAIIKRFLPWTLFSLGLALILSFSVGMILGVVIAFRREGLLDHILTVIGSFLSAVPDYLMAIIIIVWLGVQLEILPIAEMRGVLSPGVHPELSLAFIQDALFHVFPVVAVYFLATVGRWMLTMKNSSVAVLEEDYVTVGRAKGLKDSRILGSYVGRNASLPLFTALTITLGFIVGGSVLVESIFNYRGIGHTLFQAITRRDYTLMQAIFLILTFSVIFANFFTDILYGWIDPRIRLDNSES